MRLSEQNDSSVNEINTHNNQLTDIRWLVKRDRALAKGMYKCSKCGSVKKLEVHHLYYVFGKSIWEYPFKALLVLCRKCHQEWHDNHECVYRVKVWCKKKEYIPPVKSKKKNERENLVKKIIKKNRDKPISKVKRALKGLSTVDLKKFL